jgi:hypothetical protein
VNIKDQILQCNDRRSKPVETPEWPCARVYVRTLSHAERRKLFATQEKEPDLYLARLAALVACDEAGSRIFNDEDAPVLAGKSGAVLDRIAETYMAVSTLKPEEVKALEKNS